MIEITVKMQIEELSAETKGFLASLFAPYGGCVPCTCGIQTEEEQAKGPGLKPEVKAEDTKPTVDPNPAPEVRAEDPKPEAKPESKKVTYKTEDVRAAMASKLAEHRVELVNKLKDMGAKNISSLPEEKYEEFINFCNSL